MDVDNDIEHAVAAVQAGDANAYAVVVNACQRQLRAAVASRCPPALDPDEIAQQAFVEAYAKIDQYEPGTKFYVWLWVLARNRLLMRIRKMKRRRTREETYVTRIITDKMDEDLSRETRATDDRLQALRECMAQLSENARSLLHTRYDEGKRLKNVAERLGRSIGGVKNQLFAIRKTLRECIERKLTAT